MAGAIEIFRSLRWITHELILFSAAGFLLGGVSDLAIDLIWLGRTAWRRLTIYRRYPRASIMTLPHPERTGRIAIFIPAWDESTVIAPMLRHAVGVLGDGDWRIYVGAYPNDPATIAAVRSVISPHVRLVVGDVTGPSTKADCLNSLWAALVADELSGIMYHLPERRAA